MVLDRDGAIAANLSGLDEQRSLRARLAPILAPLLQEEAEPEP